jgi:chromate transporter
MPGSRARLAEIASLFLKLGTIGFGGPATHLALMEDEVVERRGWMSRQQYLDLIGATNLIPGPNSTEMAIHLGLVRGGMAGLVVAGCAFVLPAMVITTVFAWLYVTYGQLPQIEPIIGGIKPAVLAIIFTAGWRLGRKALNGWLVSAVAAGVAIASLAGAREIPVLLAGSLIGTICLLSARRRAANRTIVPGLIAAGGLSGLRQGMRAWPALPLLATAQAASSPSLLQLGLFFLKVGAVLYGTGYVLIAYLQGGLVEQYGWLTQEQLLDAIAIGQFTPGPILSTATFIGYVLMSDQGMWQGCAGAGVATLAVFLPSFLLVAITNPLVPRLRSMAWTAAFLDAVNAASLGLMAAVSLQLAIRVLWPQGVTAWPDWWSLWIAGLATAVLLRYKLSAIWIVVGGAALGALGHAWFGGA